MLADGRCLFRAIAHGACLRNGEEAPDEKNRRRELADELRAQICDACLNLKLFIVAFKVGVLPTMAELRGSASGVVSQCCAEYRNEAKIDKAKANSFGKNGSRGSKGGWSEIRKLSKLGFSGEAEDKKTKQGRWKNLQSLPLALSKTKAVIVSLPVMGTDLNLD
ncbi:hypothetical protein K1719_040243 [Acacia pycnantha]|nr:hypothetical protein K1719_040243 [Acacia pycnantha]